MQLQSQLTEYALDKYIQEITAVTFEHGGTASKLEGYELLPLMDAWQFPKCPSKTVILPSEADLVEALKSFSSAYEIFLGEPDCWLGSWINPQTHCFYLDITTSCNELNEAERMALARVEGSWPSITPNAKKLFICRIFHANIALGTTSGE
jgi:hypothetical protein